MRPVPAVAPNWEASCNDGSARWIATPRTGGYYYSHTFNSARLNPKVMQGHLPVSFWKNLPEGALIPALIGEARHGKRIGEAWGDK